MSENITAVNDIRMTWQQVYSLGDLSGVAPVKRTLRSVFSVAGDAADRCDTFYYKKHDFLASTPQTLNLKSLPNIFGAAGTVVFARVRFRACWFEPGADPAAYLDLGNDGTADEWSLPDGYLSAGGTERILAGTDDNDGFSFAQGPGTAGWTVSAGGRLWLLTPSAHAFSAHILLAGSAT